MGRTSHSRDTRATNVTANSSNSVVLHNGTISFRNITDANVFSIVNGSGFRITNMTFVGNNAFRLNNASNATGLATYTFNTGLGATNYSRLELQNNARWRSTTLRIGSGGSLVGNGTVESTSVTNLGTIAPGKSADFIVLNANPLDDIMNTRRIAQVYLRGRQIDRTSLSQSWSRN